MTRPSRAIGPGCVFAVVNCTLLGGGAAQGELDADVGALGSGFTLPGSIDAPSDRTPLSVGDQVADVLVDGQGLALGSMNCSWPVDPTRSAPGPRS